MLGSPLCLGERAVAAGEFSIDRGIGIASDLTEFINWLVANQWTQK